jgi:DNA polymerase
MTHPGGNALNLDARQRAMLEEMGIKLQWWPKGEAPEAPLAEPSAAAGDVAAVPPQAAAPAVERVVPAPARPMPASPVASPAVAARVPVAATHGAAVLADAPRRLYGGEGASEGGWLVVADMPPELDGRHGEPFAGDAGRLLDNMLRALQLHAGPVPVHLVRTHRGVASGQPASPQPVADALAAHAQGLMPRIVLAMGPLAAQSLLESSEPIGKLRGRVAPLAMPSALQGLPVVATYHPAFLLRNPADKARAWADLCLAAEQIANAG